MPRRNKSRSVIFNGIINPYNSNTNYPRNARRTRKMKQAQKLVSRLKHFNSMNLPQPGWYLIPEIPYTKFLVSVERLFMLLEKYNRPPKMEDNMIVENNSKSDVDVEISGKYDDIFMKRIFLAQTRQSEGAWHEFENMRRFQNGLAACLGDFHEELAGKFPGWRTMHTGHWSGVNIIHDTSRNYFMEWKNRAEYSSKKKVFESFEKILKRDSEVKVILVHVNVPEGWKAPAPILRNARGEIIIDLTKPEYEGRVFILSGKDAYARMSGSPDFYERLAFTLSNVFTDASMKSYLERAVTAMNER